MTHVHIYEAVQALTHKNISMKLQKGKMKAGITVSFKQPYICVCVCVCVCVSCACTMLPELAGFKAYNI